MDRIPGADIITYESGRTDLNEIFELTQPIPGIYEFRPFEDFYRTFGKQMTIIPNKYIIFILHLG